VAIAGHSGVGRAGRQALRPRLAARRGRPLGGWWGMRWRATRKNVRIELLGDGRVGFLAGQIPILTQNSRPENQMVSCHILHTLGFVPVESWSWRYATNGNGVQAPLTLPEGVHPLRVGIAAVIDVGSRGRIAATGHGGYAIKLHDNCT
jgi:hypothetical protein